MVKYRFARVPVYLFVACASLLPALATAAEINHAQASFAGTEWSLVTLAGRPVAQDGSQAHLEFAVSSNQSEHLSGAINASDGCNRLTGSFQKDGAALRIKVGPFTALACAAPRRLGVKGVDPSKPGLSFGDALRSTARVEIHGTTLVLEDRNGTVLAGFLDK